MNSNPALLLTLALVLLLAIEGTGRTEGYSLWVEHSAAKVLRDAQSPEKPPKSAELFAARGEWESFQIVLRAEEAISNVSAEASALQKTDGKVLIPAGNVCFNLVEYVPIMDPPVPYPDPLPPLRKFDLQPGETQPIWVTVKVDSTCPPGDYEGTIKITADGVSSRKVPVRLHVWNFRLPVTPRCVTAFGITMESVARTHGVTGDAAKTLELHKKYYELLLDYKISPYSIPVHLKSAEAKAYLEDPRMTSYMIPYPEDDAELRDLVGYLIENGWFKKGYFYPLDEPVNKDAYDRLAAIAERLRSIEPNYRLVSPFFRGPDFAEGKTLWDFALGQVNIWCPNEHYFDLEKRTRPFLKARRNAGDDVWWYVCCGPGSPYSNFFVEMPAMAHRMLFWHQKRENVDGLLYWSTTYWNPDLGVADPWKNMRTVPQINPNIFGDGSLLYPGKAVGVDGPVASQRLAVIRDGIEDFDYLCLAEEFIGRDATAGYARRLAKSLTEYELDPWKLEKVRRELGKAIEAARSAADERGQEQMTGGRDSRRAAEFRISPRLTAREDPRPPVRSQRQPFLQAAEKKPAAGGWRPAAMG